MSKSQVSIVKTGTRPDYDAVLAAVRRSIDLIGGLEEVVKSGQTVLINPSWVASPADKETGTCTWPEVSRAVADVIKEAGARPIIAESSAVGVDCEKVIKESGHAELRDLGYEVVNLKQDKTVKIPVPGGGLIFDPMPVWATVVLDGWPLVFSTAVPPWLCRLQAMGSVTALVCFTNVLKTATRWKNRIPG